MKQYELSPEVLAQLDLDEFCVPDGLQAAVQRWGSATGLGKAKLAVLAMQVADQQPMLDRKNHIDVKAVWLKGPCAAV